MPLSQADRQLLAGGASLNTIKTLRKFYRGDFHAQTELDKTQGVNDEVATAINPSSTRHSGDPTDLLPGCPLSYACFLLVQSAPIWMYVLIKFGMKVLDG